MPSYLYNGSHYPVILAGSGYVTTRQAAKCLFNESMNLPFLHLEDVFLTGFAAENCAIPRFKVFLGCLRTFWVKCCFENYLFSSYMTVNWLFLRKIISNMLERKKKNDLKNFQKQPTF